MPIETLNCPMCGAPTSSEAPQCEHCGARLAKVACPHCFGLVFEGAKFCSHCGAPVAPVETEAQRSELCPRCRVNMEQIALGATRVCECPKCEGLWVDTDSLARICSEREQQSAALGLVHPLHRAAAGIELQVRYLPCPICQQLMNRVNFAGYSNVIVDVCKSHGTWFDCDELRRVLEFIQSGGLDTARQSEIAELEARRHQLKEMQMPGGWEPVTAECPSSCERHQGISLIADALSSFVSRSLDGF